LKTVFELILKDQESWDVFATFAKNVMWQKEEAEHRRQAIGYDHELTPPLGLANVEIDSG